MALRDTPPFRADHVGSLLRPPELRSAREEHKAGRITDERLREIEDAAITEAIEMQRTAGLRTVTDGEFRRAFWHMDFIYQIGGIGSNADERLQVKFHRANGDIEFNVAALKVTEKLHLKETIFGDHFTFLKEKAAGTGMTPKLTIPSPNMVHYRGGPASISPDVYPDVEEFWSDLAAVYADEVARLGDLGCTYLQFDDTSLAYLNDPDQRAMLKERGDDPDHLHLRYIKQINGALKNRPAGMSVTTHMCRGNFQSAWTAAGGYDFVAEALFGELEVDGFFCEWDDERSGGFEPLRFVPKGKHVVLGLVTTKTGELESKDDLKRRIEEAGRFVDVDQLCLSPQCGFSSTEEGNELTHDDQKRKLELIVETAQEVWGD